MKWVFENVEYRRRLNCIIAFEKNSQLDFWKKQFEKFLLDKHIRYKKSNNGCFTLKKITIKPIILYDMLKHPKNRRNIEVQMKQLKFDGYYGPSYISLLGFPNLFYKYESLEELIIKLEEI